MAQLVEHHLAKVRVASSNLVVRSNWFSLFQCYTVWCSISRQPRRPLHSGVLDDPFDDPQQCSAELLGTYPDDIGAMSPMQGVIRGLMGEANDPEQGVHLSIVGDFGEVDVVDQEVWLMGLGKELELAFV